MNKSLITLIVLGVAAYATSLFAHAGHNHGGAKADGSFDPFAPKEVSAATAKHIGIKVNEIDMESIDEVVSLYGVVKPLPDMQEQIAARIDAQVSKIHVRVGQKVKKGDVLVTLSRADGTEIPMKVEYLKEGVVTDIPVVAGRWTEAGHELVHVSNYSLVQIEGELPESLISRLRNAQSKNVRIRIPSDKSYLSTGSVRVLSPELDPVKRTAHLIVDALNNDGILRGEMWVKMNVVIKEVKSALVVPPESLIQEGPEVFVFIKNGGMYQRQAVQTGISDDRFVQIKDGLAPGDEVVVQGAYSLDMLKPRKKK